MSPEMTLAALAIVMAVLVAALLFAARGKQKGLEWIVKPLAALTFVAAGLLLGALETAWGTILFAGLVLAAIGDVLLIPKKTFLAGLVSFLLGHVAYAIAFAVRGVDARWAIGAGLVLVVVAVPVVRWLLPHVRGHMRMPVLAYVAVITAMVALALGTYGARSSPLILIGAVGFYLSDLSVARDKFVAPGFVNRLWGLPLYFFAQLVLAASAGEP
jgi:uncharacterized membrane protein YhhN